MKSGKKIIKWGLVVLASLIYLSIGAIPFLNNNPSDSQAANLKGILKILTVGEMVVLGVMLAILIAVIVVCLKKKAKVKSLVREYESEVKRITWFSWKDTKKSTVVVLIALVVCAAVISLLDLGLAEGILAFIGLF